MTATNQTTYDAEAKKLLCYGEWNLQQLPVLQKLLKKITWPDNGAITILGDNISKMDTSGAWLLNRTINLLKEKGVTVRLRQFSNQHVALVSLIGNELDQDLTLPKFFSLTNLQQIGKNAIVIGKDMVNYFAFLGRLTVETLRIIVKPSHIRFGAISASMYRNGVQALPIIALLSFMIGVVLAYQMGIQLKNYGANIYIVDLLGLSILREFGPLLTAIMVAGRTGSAYTAQLGMIKLNQEIDALDTLGITPAELLLLPRIIGLVIALPLLTIWAVSFGIFGGMVMSNNMLGISWYDFLHRFPHVIPLKTLLIGLGKTPVFALLIATIGCYEGMQVKDTAESVGKNTTRSVVLAIFFIILADAAFSILFSKMSL